MKIFCGLKKVSKLKNPVVVLGVFDGVHLGHRNILKSAVSKARSIKGTSVVLTFWPHPQREKSLYSLQHRLRLIEELGIDICIVINFNRKFAKISAQDFVRDILVARLCAHYVYVGKNFRFGQGAEGDSGTLERLSGVYNFKLKLFGVKKIKNKPISSTYIRSLINGGRLDDARKLLNRPVSILGTIIRGRSLAKKLGFPTANINPHHEIIPASGVYAVRIIFKQKIYRGACYIGTRPTLKGAKSAARKNIEVHIFNFHKEIYGQYLEIQFIKKIREEKKFDSLSSLSAQIRKDIKSLKQ